MKIVLDYGHCLSGPDTGAAGNGYREENLTREIGRAVKVKLEKLGYIVIVVSPDYATSVSDSLNRRISASNATNPDISVSIHLNAGGGRGTEIYTKNAIQLSEAVSILKEMNNLGYVNRGIKDGSALALVGSVIAKSMLIETCFIDSSDMSIYNPDKISTAIVKGLTGSAVTNPSNPQVPSNSGNNVNKYLNLLSHVSRWRIYPLTKLPVVGNEVGFILPSNFGGLSYKIIANPQADVYTIYSESYGTVNIYAPRDNDSLITSKAIYSGVPSSNNDGKKFLNLNISVASWRVYPLSKSPTIGNEVGSLAPSRYGGLSYEILGNPQTDVYTINTTSFGRVNIYAPRDNDSSITLTPIY